MAVPLVMAAVVAPAQVLVGDWAAREVAEHQPTKLAAFEGLGRTQAGAPFHLGGWYDEEANEVRYGIAIPKLLSLLAFHDPNATVQGLDRVPPEDRPPVNVVRVAFFTMVGIGTADGGVRRLAAGRVVAPPHAAVRAAGSCGSSPRSGRSRSMALIAGWVTTEVGRQPWVVYGRMRTEEAVTGAGGIPLGYAALVVIYLALAVATAWLLRRLARRRSLEVRPMGLAEVPLLLALIGLAAYVVLGGADFGAGLWYVLLAGRAAAAAARSHLPRHGAGVGGQPRLADLRARRGLDRVPDGVRRDLLDALRAALRGGARDHPARRLLRPAQRRVDGPRRSGSSARCSASRRC